jgi:CO dehydrogenase maturation factor
MEAGVEHLGRGTAAGVDALVVVAEPGSRSLETAQHIKRLAADIGLDKRFFLLLNKVRDQGKSTAQAQKMLPGAQVLGAFPFNERFILADEERKSILDVPDTAGIIDSFQHALNALIATVAQQHKAKKETV